MSFKWKKGFYIGFFPKNNIFSFKVLSINTYCAGGGDFHVSDRGGVGETQGNFMISRKAESHYSPPAPSECQVSIPWVVFLQASSLAEQGRNLQMLEFY